MDKKITPLKWYRRPLTYVTIGAVVVMVVCYTWVVWGSNKSVLNVEQEKLTLCKVWRGNFQEYVPTDGTVAPGETIYLDILQGGMVEKVYAEDGSMVKKGDTLIKLANANLELEYINRETQIYDILNNLQTSRATLAKRSLELQSQLLESGYKLSVATRKYEMNKSLHQTRTISEEEYADSQKEYEYLVQQRENLVAAYRADSIFITRQMQTLASNIERIRNNAGAIRKILEQLYITAPLDGQLSSLNAITGELKQPGNRLGQIDLLHYYKLLVKMDERYIARVYAGQEADVEYMGKNYGLHVSKILPEVKDGTFSVYLLFANGVPTGIKRGQNLQVRVKFGGSAKALMVNRGAFYQSTGGNWVYVVQGNKATKRIIKTGRQNVHAYEVLEGLEPGETVITSSYATYEDKDVLNLK